MRMVFLCKGTSNFSTKVNLNKNAQTLTVDEVKNKLKTLTLGQKSDKVVSLMANTFRALSDLADWSAVSPSVTAVPNPIPSTPIVTENKKPENETKALPHVEPKVPSDDVGLRPLQLHYDIQIHLPESRDPAVYEAIFAALRKHLP